MPCCNNSGHTCVHVDAWNSILSLVLCKIILVVDFSLFCCCFGLDPYNTWIYFSLFYLGALMGVRKNALLFTCSDESDQLQGDVNNIVIY